MSKTQRNFSSLRKLPVKDQQFLLDSTAHKPLYETIDRASTLEKTRPQRTLRFDNITESILRKKIFTTKTVRFNHIQIGASSNDLTFQDLDKTFLPACFSTSKCKCKNLITPCQNILAITTPESRKEMKTNYNRLKSTLTGNQHSHRDQMNKLLNKLPVNFPEALVPTLESMTKLEAGLTPATFNLLAFILLHSKIDYLAFWIHRELVNAFEYQKQHIEEYPLSNCIHNVSTSLTNTIIKQGLNLAEFVQWFIGSYGVFLISPQMYSLFIHYLNKKGRQYPSRVILALLLYLHPSLCCCDNIQDALKKNQQNIPWQAVLKAALDPRLY